MYQITQGKLGFNLLYNLWMTQGFTFLKRPSEYCPLLFLITDLNVDAEVVKLLLRDAEETEGEAGVQAGDADPTRVRDVITGVSLPLPDITRHLGGVGVQVQHLGIKDIIALELELAEWLYLIVDTSEKIQSMIGRAADYTETTGKTETLLEACFVHGIDFTEPQSQ